MRYILLILVLFISMSCSGGEENSISDNQAKERGYIPKCENGYIEVVSGDRIEPISKSPKIRIVHLTNGIRKICMLQGEGRIVKGE